MATTPLTRNLRDGQLVVKDGQGSPAECTVVLDEGDLQWTETLNTIKVLDRGILDHHRPGDEECVSLSFSLKWVQMLGATEDASDGNVLYEMVNNIGDTYTSVATYPSGEQFALLYEFTVTDPAGVATELVTFAEVYKESFECAEGDEYNTIKFSGVDFETEPTISRP